MDYETTAAEALAKHTKESLRLYKAMIDNDVCREQARMVLPQNLYTYYWGTVNLNNFLKFYELRNHPGAQVEIQELSVACMDLLEEVIPETIEIYQQAKREKTIRIIKHELKNLDVEELDIMKYFLES
jgi:thymidylate synthase (FAD)